MGPSIRSIFHLAALSFSPGVGPLSPSALLCINRLSYVDTFSWLIDYSNAKSRLAHDENTSKTKKTEMKVKNLETVVKESNEGGPAGLYPAD